MATTSGALRTRMRARRGGAVVAAAAAIRDGLRGRGHDRERRSLAGARSLAELGRETGARC